MPTPAPAAIACAERAVRIARALLRRARTREEYARATDGLRGAMVALERARAEVARVGKGR